MTNCLRNDISEYDDISTLGEYQAALAAGCTKEEALKACHENSRDNARTPMQWSDGSNAGFTSGTPWLMLNPNYTEINVKEQEMREDSVLNYYKKLLALKKSDAYKETLTYGRFVPVYENEENIFAYVRVSEETGQEILIAANYGTEETILSLSDITKNLSGEKVLLSNMGKETVAAQTLETDNKLVLESCESIIVLLKTN